MKSLLILLMILMFLSGCSPIVDECGPYAQKAENHKRVALVMGVILKHH
jgi:uncharacterized protein YceK